MTRIQKWVVGVFVTLYALTSTLSTIHSVDFFRLANPQWLAVSLAIAFEVGAAACLAAIVVLDKTTRWMVWTLFSLVTAVQIVGNMYYAYSHLEDFRQWSELFGLSEQEPILQKRVLSIIAGGILPLVALGFVKSLVDVVKPRKSDPDPVAELLDVPKEPTQARPVEPTEVAETALERKDTQGVEWPLRPKEQASDRYPAGPTEGEQRDDAAPTKSKFGGL